MVNESVYRFSCDYSGNPLPSFRAFLILFSFFFHPSQDVILPPSLMIISRTSTDAVMNELTTHGTDIVVEDNGPGDIYRQLASDTFDKENTHTLR